MNTASTAPAPRLTTHGTVAVMLHRSGSLSVMPSEINDVQAVHEAATAVFEQLGWGWQESVYREALCAELRSRSHTVETEVSFPVTYKGRPLSNTFFRVDMLVNGTLVVELKAGLTSAPDSAVRQCTRYIDMIGGKGMVVQFRRDGAVIHAIDEVV